MLLDDFAACFAGCDHLLVMDIYAASEAPIEGISAQLLVGKIHLGGVQNVEYQPSAEAVISRLNEIAQPGDLVLTLGAGSVWQVGEKFLESRKPEAKAGIQDRHAEQSKAAKPVLAPGS